MSASRSRLHLYKADVEFHSIEVTVYARNARDAWKKVNKKLRRKRAIRLVDRENCYMDREDAY